MTGKSLPATEIHRRASRIAVALGDSSISGLHLLLSLMVDPESTPARIVDERGGGDYVSARQALRHLPSGHELVGDVASVAVAGPSLFRRAVRWLVALARRRRAWQWRSPDGIPLSPSGAMIEDIAYDVPGGETRWAEKLLVVLSSVPGPAYRFLGSHASVVAASARKSLGIAQRFDSVRLAIDRVPRGLRRLRRKIHERYDASPTIGIRLIKLGWSSAAVLWTIVYFLTISLTATLMYVFILPGLVLLNSCRYTVARLVRVDIVTHRHIASVGGETEILSHTTRKRALVAVLGPRVAAFAIGVVGLAPFIIRSHDLGQPPLRVVLSRPDLLHNPVFAPFWLVADVFSANGLMAGVTLLAAVGSLFVSLPSFSEMQFVAFLMERDGRMPLVARLLLSPARTLVRALDAVDGLLPWTGGPLYVTAHIVPVIGGTVFAILLVGILGR